MGIGILAPVPASILRAAQKICAEVGRVAFGSNAWVFSKIGSEYGVNLPALIYPTRVYGDPDYLCDPGFATFRAIYLGATNSHAGKHADPAIRPAPTIEGYDSDAPWAFFWEVSALAELPKRERVAVTSLIAEGQTKPLPKGFVPHGPTLVKAAFL